VVGGALVGGIIGGSSTSDRWEEIPLDELRVSLLPERHGGFAVGVRLKL
jgi:hypothetical protein